MTPNGPMERIPWRRTLAMLMLVVKRDRARRIDQVIDYFGEPKWRGAQAALRLPVPVVAMGSHGRSSPGIVS